MKRSKKIAKRAKKDPSMITVSRKEINKLKWENMKLRCKAALYEEIKEMFTGYYI